MKEIKRRLVLDDFEYRLLVGCVNKARTMFIDENKPVEDVKDKNRAVVAHCGKTIMNTIMEEKAESTALIPYFLCGDRHAETVFFYVFGSVSDTLASNDFGNPKSIPLVREKPLKPLP